MQQMRLNISKEIWEALIDLSVDEMRPAKMQVEKILAEKLVELGYLSKNDDGEYIAIIKKEKDNG